MKQQNKRKKIKNGKEGREGIKAKTSVLNLDESVARVKGRLCDMI
jgi:hypothetical protein